MTHVASPLFEPLQIGTLSVPGRVIKTATSETRANEDGTCSDALIDFYQPLAAAGTPLIITGNIYVSRNGQSTPRQLGADSDDKILGLAALAASVHQHGGLVFAQISHCGRQVVPASIGQTEAVAPSAVMELTTGTKPRALEIDEIERIIDDFGDAARRCKEAGFDGVQIHAGHGYLISQFLTPYTNRRDDGYGGSFMGRTRFLREVHQAIRFRVGDDFPVILKINGSDRLTFRPGLKSKELAEVAHILEGDGIDAVEVSVGHYESGFPVVRGTFQDCLRGMVNGSVRFLPLLWRAIFRSTWRALALVCNWLWPHSEGFNLHDALRFKRLLKIPVICVGGFLNRHSMEAAIETGFCDAVSLGRSFIADPYLYAHLRTETEGPRCVFCNACVGVIGTEPLDCYDPEVRQAKDALLAGPPPEINVEGEDQAAPVSA